MNNYFFVGFAVLVLSLTIVQSFQIRGLATTTGAVVAGGQIDTTGWAADEIMNYEMHGIIPARVQQTAVTNAAPQMVGGC